MNPRSPKPILSESVVSALVGMTDDRSRRAFLQKRRLLRADVVAALNNATQKEFRINANNALPLADAALVVARATRKDALLAQSYRLKANVLAAAGDYQHAITAYNSALEIFEKRKDQEGVARTLTAAIQPHIMLGNYDHAFRAAERAQTLFHCLGDDRRLARLENNIGNIYHRQDRFAEALQHYERAYQDLLPYGDSEELSISLNNMSMCLITMNDFPRALATYEKAKQLLEARDLPLIRLIADYNIAYLYYMRGDYGRSIEMLKNARLEGEKIAYTYLVALCYLDLSDIYVELNLTSEAQEVAEQGHLLFSKLEIGYEAAKTLANQAIAYGQEGKAHRAIELFTRAKPLFVKEKNEVWPWLIDLYQAVVLFSEGRHFEARRLAVSAASFFDGSLLKNKAAVCRFLLAQIALETGDLAEARSSCARALDLLKHLDAPILRYQGHFLRGQVEHQDGNLQAAYSAYQAARSELESLRSSLRRDELKISFMKNKTELYEHLVDLCLVQEPSGSADEEAFGYIELAKSRSLTELIFQRTHALPEAQPGQSELVHKIRELREELNWYQHRIEQEQLRPERNAAERIEQLRAGAQEREKSLLRVLGDLPQTESALSAATQGVVPLEAIRSNLSGDATVLEYFFAGDRIIVSILTSGGLEVRPITTAPCSLEAMRLLRFQLGRCQFAQQSGVPRGTGLDRATAAHLKTLYEELIAPVRSLLTTPHLVIVPHGQLHYLPFHALYDGEEFLLDRFFISYAPSASVFALCHGARLETQTGSLVLGIPDQHAPLIREEVEAVHRSLPGSHLLLGAAATHQALAQHAESCRVIHVATHGSFRPDNPMFSGIRLGDGFLHLYELLQMRLPVDLLALSGCATGLNVVGAGDELLGLIRGALYAGARSLLLTLWDVNDRSATQFMQAFYRQWQEGMGKAQAMSVAAKEVRQEYGHPYYWAPFVLVGKGLSS